MDLSERVQHAKKLREEERARREAAENGEDLEEDEYGYESSSASSPGNSSTLRPNASAPPQPPVDGGDTRKENSIALHESANSSTESLEKSIHKVLFYLS